MSEIMSKYINNNDPSTLYHLIIYQHSLKLSITSNLYEESDLTGRYIQLNNMLVEIFKCDNLDKVDNVLQLLMPLLDFRGYDNKHFEYEFSEKFYSQQIQNQQKRFIIINSAYGIKYEGKCVIQYCIKNGLKFIFQFSQISGIIDKVFRSTITPTGMRMYRDVEGNYSRLFYMGNTNYSFIETLNNMVEYYINFSNISIVQREKYFDIMEMQRNGRYCPIYMFTLESISKFMMFVLVTYLCLNYDADDSYIKILEVLLKVMIVGHIVNEIGQFQDHNYNLSLYFSSWNILDISSLVFLLLWMILMDDIGRLCLCLSSIPLSLVLLQAVSINKAVGQLIIMIIAITSDVMSFFTVYVVSTIGVTVAMTGLSSLIDSNSDDDGTESTRYHTFISSFLQLYSGTLGSFDTLVIDSSNSGYASMMTFLLAIYLLASSGLTTLYY
jgi:hypothetical protein